MVSTPARQGRGADGGSGTLAHAGLVGLVPVSGRFLFLKVLDYLFVPVPAGIVNGASAVAIPYADIGASLHECLGAV